MANRKVVDCRDAPSEMNCSLKISGSEEEVMQTSMTHMVAVHGQQQGDELRQMVMDGMKDEE